MRQAPFRHRRVVIVDDSRTMQAMLEHTLSVRLGWEIVGIAGDGESAITMVKHLKPDLVTIDLALPYIDGRQLLTELAAYRTMYKVVISASACNNLAIKSSLEALGADLCICKTEMSRDPDEFRQKLLHLMREPKASAPVASEPKIGLKTSAGAFPIPVDERERLAALTSLGLANDNAERRLDLLTEHLAKTTSFSACVMTFIDQNTQWVKSGYGLDRGSMDRSQAICNYTICGDEPFIVQDTKADVRFHQLDVVVAGPMIRSYVGHPIIGSSGVRLGALCLLDTKPRHVTMKELVNLRSIARIAGEMIENGAPVIKEAA